MLLVLYNNTAEDDKIMTKAPLETFLHIWLRERFNSLFEWVWAEFISHSSQMFSGITESTFVDTDLYR